MLRNINTRNGCQNIVRMKIFNKTSFSLGKLIPWLLLQSNVLSCSAFSVEESSLWLLFCPWGWNGWRGNPNSTSPPPPHPTPPQISRKIQILSLLLSVVMSDSKETLSIVCDSSSMMCIPLLWVMLQLLLLPASIEFTLNSHAEVIIFWSYSFWHNLSVLASDPLGNKRLEMEKLDCAWKQPWRCLQCLYITAIYNVSLSSSRKANILSAEVAFLFDFFFFLYELPYDRSPCKNLWQWHGHITNFLTIYVAESLFIVFSLEEIV